MLQFQTNTFGRSSEEFFLRVINLYLPLRSQEEKGRVRVLLDGNELNVEPAIARLLELQGCEVLTGEQVHIVGHVLTGKFMGTNDHEIFKNWAHSYGYDDLYLNSILTKSDELLQAYLRGDESVVPQLLQSLIERWDIYNTPVEKRKHEIRILTDFWMNNKETLRRWVQWYTKLAYDPGGAPDLFTWDCQSNDWSWIEVKSLGDSLNKKQWWWIEQFMTNVAHNVAIVRVISSDF